MPGAELAMGNPTALFATGPSGGDSRVVLLFTAQYANDTEGSIWDRKSRGSRWPHATESFDGGATWSRPRNITRTTKREAWTWYATGPGAGIQLRHGQHAGRLVVPCDHVADTAKGLLLVRSHMIYTTTSAPRGSWVRWRGRAPTSALWRS
ncbi:unnamed protein product [Prorocentrum cordatum]|uniref:Exo-alpha-sialidase n=1 Tax=Prorocentrum cordatum TaxID=2364126 RepID=A0ABN9SE08_9DINO|nr:unnamed protein product [Polarella glacialis]